MFYARVRSVVFILLTTFSFSSAFGMDLAQIMEKYPNGWASIKDENEFYMDVSSLLIEDSDGDYEEDNGLRSKAGISETQASQAVRDAYKRSETQLAGKNDDLLVSMLCFADLEGDNFMALGVESLLKRFLTDRNIGEDHQNKFLGESLWHVQLVAMRNIASRFGVGKGKDNNLCVPLIYKYFDLLLPKYRYFVDKEIIPNMKSCGFERAIPSWAVI